MSCINMNARQGMERFEPFVHRGDGRVSGCRFLNFVTRDHSSRTTRMCRNLYQITTPANIFGHMSRSRGLFVTLALRFNGTWTPLVIIATNFGIESPGSTRTSTRCSGLLHTVSLTRNLRDKEAGARSIAMFVAMLLVEAFRCVAGEIFVTPLEEEDPELGFFQLGCPRA